MSGLGKRRTFWKIFFLFDDGTYMGRNLSYDAGRKHAKILLCALLSFVEDLEESKDCKADWQAGTELWVTHSTLEGLAELTKRYSDSLDAEEIRNALNCLINLKILDDKRGQTNAKTRTNSKVWLFALKFPSIDKKENLNWLFKPGGEWDKCREAQKNNSGKVAKTPKEKSQGANWQEICRNMLEKHKRLTTNQLLFADEDMKFELTEIHVPLALVERSKPKKCSEDISAEQGSRLYEPSYEEKQRFEHEAFLGQIIRDGVGKTQGQRIALIGEPGAGKTTHLQTIAFWILKNNLGLPIWISLADLQGKSVENYLLQDWLKNALEVVRVTEEQEKAFADLFKNNSVWLLLDAADEMSSPQPLTEISQQLTGWVKNARVVLTCRVNVWEANANALENFETYRLLNFEYPQQVQEFIRGWFHKKDADKGERLSKELDKAERQRIQDLVKNPLRLALLCSTWQSSDKGLPQTKAGLYHLFVKRFYTWRKNSFCKTQKERQTLNAALGRLAKSAIDQKTSRFRLRYEFVSNELGDPEEEGSLFWLALKLGWLNQIGLAAESDIEDEVYAFFHPTFEEYFAALAVKDWHYLLDHSHQDPKKGTYRIFEPQWKEVFLLWLGREEVLKEEKEELINILCMFNKQQGFHWYQAIFLAAAGIAEFSDYSNADYILMQIIMWTVGYMNNQQQWHEINDNNPISNGARALLKQTDRNRAIKILTHLLSSTPNNHIRPNLAKCIALIDPSNPYAVKALTKELQNSQDENICLNLAVCLGVIDSGNPDAIQTLTNYLLNCQNDDTRLKVALSLSQVGNNPEAIKVLEQIIDSSQDEPTRSDILRSLLSMDSGNTKAINVLEKRLNSSNDLISIEAALMLHEIGNHNLDVIKVLEKNGFSIDKSFRENLDSFRETMIIDPVIFTNLIVQQMCDDQNNELLCSELVRHLGEFAVGNPDSIKILTNLIRNSHSKEICAQAAKSLKKILQGKLFQEVVVKLKDCLSEQVGKNEPYRFFHCYEVIWHCAENMTYPAFYQAWHQQEKVKDKE